MSKNPKRSLLKPKVRRLLELRDQRNRMQLEQVENVALPELHPAQQDVMRDVIESQARYKVLVCGRRWGKSTLGVRLLLEKAIEGYPVAWFAPTYKLLEEVLWYTARMADPIVSRRDLQARRIELNTGGTLEFWTLDDPITVARGRKYARVILDEAAMVKHLQEAWQQAISPTLVDYQGDAWFLSTPKGDNYFKKLYDDAATREHWKRWHYPSITNPYLLPGELEAQRLQVPELVFRQEYLAEFVTNAGTRIKLEHLNRAEPPPTNTLDIVMGVDLAISTRQEADFTACVVLGRDAKGHLWVLDVQRRQASFYDVLEFIRGMAARWTPRRIGIEQVQYQAAVVTELLRTTVLPVAGIRPDRDKVTRFAPVEVRYQQGLVTHSSELQRDFEDELLAFPLGKNDDMVDAMSYAVQVLGPFEEDNRMARGGRSDRR